MVTAVAAVHVNEVKMEVDEALEKLGTVGRWQILCYIVISTACFLPPCFHMLAINYIGKLTSLFSVFIASVFLFVYKNCLPLL